MVPRHAGGFHSDLFLCVTGDGLAVRQSRVGVPDLNPGSYQNIAKLYQGSGVVGEDSDNFTGGRDR